MKYFQRKSRGAAAILVTMLVLAFIATISFIVARVMIQEIRVSRDITKSFRAREVAVSGLERGGMEIKNNNPLGGGVTDTLPDGGDYTVKLEDSKLVSVGRFEEAERQLFIDLGSVPISSVAAGAGHTLALDQNGHVWAWGRNGFGQLGDDSINNRNTPGKVLAGNQPGGNTYLSNIKSIAAGNGLSLALDTNGKVWAWGSDSQGQLGNAAMLAPKKTPIGVEAGEQGAGFLSDIKEISSAGDPNGGYHVLALDNSGNVWSWGENIWGQVGFGNNSGPNVRKETPIHVKGGAQGGPFLVNIVDIAAGGKHSLALDASNNVWSWGLDLSGQIGNNSVGPYITDPVKVETGAQVHLSGYLVNIVDIAAGGDHSLALDASNNVWSWGNNLNGQLGDDDRPNNKTTPVQVVNGGGAPFSNVVAIAGGGYHSLAVDGNKRMWSWGSNMFGQLGYDDNGTIPERDTPGQVVGENGAGLLSDITDIAAGGSHSLARDTAFFSWAWGYNLYGQLGNGNYTHQDTPVKISIF